MRILILSALILTGCTTAPVTTKFPDAPESIMSSCPSELITIKEEKILLSEFEKIVTKNYTTYYECAEKVTGWIEWYNKQKAVHNSVK